MSTIDATTKRLIEETIARLQDDAVQMLQQLVRIPSENHPPTGDEYAVQCAYRDILLQLGLSVDMFEPNDVPAFLTHPGRTPEHDMRGRPNVVSTIKGSGGGKSLLLIGHADVETPGDDALWTHGSPYSGAYENGRIYGRGSGDDKSGLMNNAMVVRVLQECGITLHGDLIVASVADEERAGSNGTVAMLAKGYRADGCINVDGISQNMAISNLGGGYCHLDLLVPSPVADGTELINFFDEVRRKVQAFNTERVAVISAHPHYSKPPYNSHAVKITEVNLAIDDYTHGSMTVWFYLLPGETGEEFKTRFAQALSDLTTPGECRMQWVPRLVLGSEIAESDPFAQSLFHAYTEATGRQPKITGGPMSDMGFVNIYGQFPCICHAASRWGEEGMAHGPNEFVEVDKLMECLKTVVFCALDWCGYTRAVA